MERPCKYLIFDLKNKVIIRRDDYQFFDLETYEPTDDPNVRVLKQTKKVFINERYKAEMRLYNYVTYTRKGLEIPRYRPFQGTEIGKTIPILNF